jgi:hypothetical protein
MGRVRRLGKLGIRMIREGSWEEGERKWHTLLKCSNYSTKDEGLTFKTINSNFQASIC